MRMGFMGRVVLLAMAALCLGLFVAVPAAMAGFGGATLYSGTTEGVSMDGWGSLPAALRITGSVTDPPSSNTVDSGEFFSTTSGFYMQLVDVGPLGYFADLSITVAVWDPAANGGLGGIDQDWQMLADQPIAANPDNTVTSAWYLQPKPSTFTGMVKNSKTGAAIAGARVAVVGLRAATNSSGKFSLPGLVLWPGYKVAVRVTKSGYYTKTVGMLAFPAGVRHATIKLVHK